ncbi:MAG TPA: TolC family protein [Candidatus Binatia bacterium]|jgi:outer membrane protein TolC
MAGSQKQKPELEKAERRRAGSPARRTAVAILAISFALAASGCALTPRGLDDEKAALEAEGAALEHPVAEADLPVPRDGDDWRGLLRRALVANGEVRAAWFEWKAAVERVTGASAWPNSNLSLGYSYTFSDDKVKTFDRMTFNAAFDSMENLSFPGKTMAAGRSALAEARSSGEKFRAAKFSVQRRVLDAWLDFALAAENERIAVERQALASVQTSAAEAELTTGASQKGAAAAQIAAARSDDELRKALAAAEEARQMLAALVDIADADRLQSPRRLPDARPLPADPSVLVAAAAQGPETRQMEADAKSRQGSEDLAKLQWVPDVNPVLSIAGGVSQAVGAAVVLPTSFIEIRSGIAAAKALRRGAEARAMQTARDKRAEMAAALVAARDDGRAREHLEQRILPLAGVAVDAAESGYRSGAGTLSDIVEARTMALDVRAEIAEASVAREKQLSAIEEIAGADLETFTGTPPLRFASAAVATASSTGAVPVAAPAAAVAEKSR